MSASLPVRAITGVWKLPTYCLRTAGVSRCGSTETKSVTTSDAGRPTRDSAPAMRDMVIGHMSGHDV